MHTCTDQQEKAVMVLFSEIEQHFEDNYCFSADQVPGMHQSLICINNIMLSKISALSSISSASE